MRHVVFEKAILRKCDHKSIADAGYRVAISPLSREQLHMVASPIYIAENSCDIPAGRFFYSYRFIPAPAMVFIDQGQSIAIQESIRFQS